MQNVLGGCTAESASNNKSIDPLKRGGADSGTGACRVRSGSDTQAWWGITAGGGHLLHVRALLLQSRRTITERPVRKLHPLWRSRSNKAAHGITCLIGRRLRCAGHRKGAWRRNKKGGLCLIIVGRFNLWLFGLSGRTGREERPETEPKTSDLLF